MSLLKLLLSGSLITIVAAGIAAKSRLDKDIAPNFYKIEIYLDMKTRYYLGTSDARIKIFRETQDIQIYSRALSVNAYKLTDNVRTIYPSNLIIDKSHITVRFNETLLPGEYIFSTQFSSFTYNKRSGILNTSYINEKGDNKMLFASRGPTIGARHIFPSWDEPALTAAFNISVCVTNDLNTALSNTQLEREEWVGDYFCRHFETTPKMPPHLMGILFYDFDNESPPDVTLRCRRRLLPYLKFANIVVQNVTRYFQNDTDYSSHNPNTYHETQYVVIPYPENVLASWRLVFYRTHWSPLRLKRLRSQKGKELSALFFKCKEAEVVQDEKYNSFHNSIKVAHLVARGVAYQWIGNHVSPSWWSYMWLNEGITTLLAAEAVNKTFRDSHMMDLFVVEFQQQSLNLETDFFMEPLVSNNINDISDINSVYLFSYHIKAPCILRMLQHLITDEVFQKGIHKYMGNHKNSSASLDDFWQAMEIAHSEVKAERPVGNFSKLDAIEKNIAHIMFAWTKQKQYPVLHINETGPNTIQIALINYKELYELNWIIPLIITTQFRANFDTAMTVNSSTIIWFKKLANKHHITYHYLEIENGWMIANVQQIGYYRVQYGIKNWQKIASYLNSSEYTTIHVINRAQIIDDAFYFLTKNKLSLSLFLQLAEYLWQEGDYVAWFPMFKAFEYMSGFLPFQESTFIKEKMVSILDRFYDVNKNIDYAHPLTINLMRGIAEWRCVFGSSECMDVTNDTLIEMFQFPDRVQPQWKEFTFCAGLMTTDLNTWDQIYYMYRYGNRSDILKYLSCSKDFHINFKSMERILLDENIAILDRVNHFHSIIMRHARNSQVFHYLLTAINLFKPMEIDILVALLDIINHVYTEEQLYELKEHVENNIMPNTQKSIAKGLERKYNLLQIKKFTKNIHMLDEMIIESVMYRCIKNQVKPRINLVMRKIGLRLREIRRHRKKFQNFEKPKE